MNILALFTTAFLVGLSGAMMPGPMLTVTISEASKRGFWVGPQVVLGHGIVEILLVACLTGGLTHYIQQPIVTGVIGLIGGLVLVWLGWGTYKNIEGEAVCFGPSDSGTISTRKSDRSINPVLSGAILSITNPYWSLWWATVGVSYVIVAINLGTMGVIAFFLGHILADLAWFSLISYVINTGRNYISDQLYRGMLFACALILFFLGCWFVYDGYLKLISSSYLMISNEF